MARPSGRDIRSEVIEAATRAVQCGGVAGFSFGSLAEELGIRAASIHHHFPRKADLLVAVVAQYRDRFREQAESLDGATAYDRLAAYSGLFLRPAERDLMCLCGAAASDWSSIDPTTREGVSDFFAREIAWVAEQARKAIRTGEFASVVDPDAFATGFVAALEGALLIARVQEDPDVIPVAAALLLDLATR